MIRLTRKQRKARRENGRALITKAPPDVCPQCGNPMQGRTYHSFLGHLGLHGLANRYFDGNIHSAQKRLRENGRARSDPFQGNGAWQPYRPIPVRCEIGGEMMVRP